MKCLSLCVLIFLCLSANGQVEFISAPELLGVQDVRGTNCQAATDINGDYKADLVRFDKGNNIIVEYQNAKNSRFYSEAYTGSSFSDEWTLCVADLNNDGMSEIMASGFYNGAKIIGRTSMNQPMSLMQITPSNFFAQGSNFADINNDGFNDMFICDDDAESEIYFNDGTGNLVDNSTYIDMITVPASDNSGNYGSVWSDFDMDGDLDLYIAKCRGGVTDPTDPRRINALFVNDGNQNYTEMASAYGIAFGDQSWTADFGDIDNDGDFDLFLVHHDAPYMLYENIDNQSFIALENYIDTPVTGNAIESILKDFDNDGYLDILISGSKDYVMWNNGDKTFTVDEALLEGDDIHSFSIADLNEDGFLDIYSTYGNGFNSPGNIPDRLWINQKNNNRSVSFSLRGIQSNRSAIGAKVILEGAWGKQIREVRAGESYGIMNSLNLLFGTGLETSADKVTIEWPSGIIDVYEDFDFSEHSKFLAIEGQCVNPFFSIAQEESYLICEGESIQLTAPNLLGEILWSTGSTEETITVSETGFYYLTFTSPEGCIQQSVSVFVGVGIEEELPLISLISGDEKSCTGDEIILEASGYTNYTWSDQSQGDQLLVTETGTYSVMAQGACGEVLSEDFYVEVAEQIEAPITKNDTLLSPAMAELVALTGDSIHWYDDELGLNFVGSGQVFTTPVINQTTPYYARAVELSFNNTAVVGMSEAIADGSVFGGDQFNGGLFFNALEDFTLSRVKVFTDTFGERKITLQNAGGEIIEERIVDIQNAEQIIELDFDIAIGSGYFLSTDASFNNQILGTNSPRLARSNMGTNYPYVDDAIEIYNSFFGESYFYYFFDWEIGGEDIYCESQSVETIAFVGDPESTTDFETLGIVVYPNPLMDVLLIESEVPHIGAVLSLYNGMGQKLLTTKVIDYKTQINTSEIQAGMYYLVYQNESQRAVRKVVKKE